MIKNLEVLLPIPLIPFCLYPSINSIKIENKNNQTNLLTGGWVSDY